ncbi:MAG: hypothetical protein HXY40_07875 [Chloroflexi bacterium]|nr:hypothetical protein [Chloroflexota bacterium]
MRFKRRNVAWLAVLGAVLVSVLVLGAGLVAPQIIAALLGLYAVAVLASFVEVRPQAIVNTVQRTPMTLMRMSPQAREAVERARRRGGYSASDLMLLDIGLISTQSGEDGLMMRRTRTISKDDDGVRPFVTLHVQPGEADRTVVVRYEIIDQSGKQQYVHEMKAHLHDGEMNLLADMQLPLAGNAKIKGAGDWDLRVSVDGEILGMHNFALTPSTAERENRLGTTESEEAAAAQRREYLRRRLEAQQVEDKPLSLEDLLRGQEQNNHRR